jgi:hypothetical protein
MKILPTNRQEWLSLASVPFKAYILGVALIYPFWLSHIRRVPGLVGRGFLEDGMTCFALGCFASSVALVFVALCQIWFKDRRGAFWSFTFAFTSLCAGALLIPNYVR